MCLIRLWCEAMIDTTVQKECNSTNFDSEPAWYNKNLLKMGMEWTTYLEQRDHNTNMSLTLCPKIPRVYIDTNSTCML